MQENQKQRKENSKNCTVDGELGDRVGVISAKANLVHGSLDDATASVSRVMMSELKRHDAVLKGPQ